MTDLQKVSIQEMVAELDRPAQAAARSSQPAARPTASRTINNKPTDTSTIRTHHTSDIWELPETSRQTPIAASGPVEIDLEACEQDLSRERSSMNIHQLPSTPPPSARPASPTTPAYVHGVPLNRPDTPMPEILSSEVAAVPAERIQEVSIPEQGTAEEGVLQVSPKKLRDQLCKRMGVLPGDDNPLTKYKLRPPIPYAGPISAETYLNRYKRGDWLPYDAFKAPRSRGRLLYLEDSNLTPQGVERWLLEYEKENPRWKKFHPEPIPPVLGDTWLDNEDPLFSELLDKQPEFPEDANLISVLEDPPAREGLPLEDSPTRRGLPLGDSPEREGSLVEDSSREGPLVEDSSVRGGPLPGDSPEREGSLAGDPLARKGLPDPPQLLETNLGNHSATAPQGQDNSSPVMCLTEVKEIASQIQKHYMKPLPAILEPEAEGPYTPCAVNITQDKPSPVASATEVEAHIGQQGNITPHSKDTSAIVLAEMNSQNPRNPTSKSIESVPAHQKAEVQTIINHTEDASSIGQPPALSPAEVRILESPPSDAILHDNDVLLAPYQAEVEILMEYEEIQIEDEELPPATHEAEVSEPVDASFQPPLEELYPLEPPLSRRPHLVTVFDRTTWRRYPVPSPERRSPEEDQSRTSSPSVIRLFSPDPDLQPLPQEADGPEYGPLTARETWRAWRRRIAINESDYDSTSHSSDQETVERWSDFEDEPDWEVEGHPEEPNPFAEQREEEIPEEGDDRPEAVCESDLEVISEEEMEEHPPDPRHQGRPGHTPMPVRHWSRTDEDEDTPTMGYATYSHRPTASQRWKATMRLETASSSSSNVNGNREKPGKKFREIA